MNLHLRSKSKKYYLLNTILCVFKSYFGVFERDGKKNVWLLQHDEVFCWPTGSGGLWMEAFEKESDPQDRMCWIGSEGQREPKNHLEKTLESEHYGEMYPGFKTLLKT